MLIPIGLDKNEVRRLPWVTFGIIIINIVVFLLTGMGGTSSEKETAEAWDRVVTFWQQHPYLEPPKEFLDQQPSEAARDEFKARVEFMRQANKPPEDASVLEQEGQTLQRLVDEARATVGEHPFQKWGLKPSDVKLSAFLTCMFIHAGWLHLLGNMLFLYLSGPFVEDAMGRPLYLTFYLSAGIAAGFAQILAFPHSSVPLGGASGAIAGVMGAFLVRYARTKIQFFYFMYILRGTFEAPAWLMLPLWLAQQLFFASMNMEGGTAYWAHIGGFAYGVGVAALLRQLKVEQKYISPAIEKQISITQHPALEEGMAALARGDTAAARDLIRKALHDDPRNVDAHLAMWHCCVAENRPSDGADSIARAIDDELRRGELPLALSHWRELLAATGTGGPGPLRMRLAASAEASEPETAREILRQVAADPGAGLLAEKAVKRLAAMGEVYAPHQAPTPAPVPTPPPALDDDPFAAPASDTGTQVPRWIVEVTDLIRLHGEGLVIQGTQGGTELLPFASVRTVVVGGVAAQPRPYLIVDLVLQGPSTEPPRVVRLHSSTFDPRRILNRPDLQPLAAFRELLASISRAANATVLPAQVLSEQGRFTTYPSVEAYEDSVLTAAC
jgi:membrane associated rhomboid family serine protease